MTSFIRGAIVVAVTFATAAVLTNASAGEPYPQKPISIQQQQPPVKPQPQECVPPVKPQPQGCVPPVKPQPQIQIQSQKPLPVPHSQWATKLTK